MRASSLRKSGFRLFFFLAICGLLVLAGCGGGGGGSSSGGGSTTPGTGGGGGGTTPGTGTVSGSINGGPSPITSNVSVNLYYYSGGTSSSIGSCTVSNGAFSCPSITQKSSGIYYIVATISANPTIQLAAIVSPSPTGPSPWSGININEASTAAASYVFGAANEYSGNSSPSFSNNLMNINTQGYSGYMLSLYTLIVPKNSGSFVTPSGYASQNITGPGGTTLSISASKLNDILGNVVPMAGSIGATYSGNTQSASSNLNTLETKTGTTGTKPFMQVLLNAVHTILNDNNSTSVTVTVLTDAIQNMSGQYPYFMARMAGSGYSGGSMTSYYPSASSTTSSSTSLAATSETPAPNATGVAVSSTVSITFNSPANASGNTVTFSLNTLGGPPVSGTTSYSGDTVTFTPSANLQDNTVYAATIMVSNMSMTASLHYLYSWEFTTKPASGVTVSSIAVTPANPSIAAGSTEQFTATATYSDNSTQDVTDAATWTSSSHSVATISSSGLATASSGGTSSITASYGNKTSSPDALTVTASTSTLPFSYSPNLYAFTNSSGDGAYPDALANGPSGELYGTTAAGGQYTYGSMFKFDPSNSNKPETPVYSFGSVSGETPNALTYDPANGKFYGTAVGGGNNSDGAIFEFDPSGNAVTTLYSFAGGPGDGANPYDALTYDPANGKFYGTAANGGTFSGGAVFEFDPSNNAETLIYSFGSVSGDGETPYAALTYDPVTNVFYGTAGSGGAYSDGAIFKFDPSNSTKPETLIYSFGSIIGDGKDPSAALTYLNGVFYGTASFGGHNKTYGTIFKFDPSNNTETTIYSFSGSGDGSSPNGITYDSANRMFYGTAYYGGAYGYGAIFKFDPSNNAETTLHSFGSVSGDGENPNALLYDSADGTFYGTAGSGGKNGYGAIFEFTP